MADIHDVIIVGGGSAGCVAAARLSENPKRNVLLLEAGPDPQPLPDSVATGKRVIHLLLQSPYLAMYPANRGFDASSIYFLAGRIMGGGSSVNMMSFTRPIKADFDTWVQCGNTDWAWEQVLPILKRIEADQDYPDSPLHGCEGPLYIKRPYGSDRPARGRQGAFIEGARLMGLPLCPDQNVPNPVGICRGVYNIKDGKRQSTVVAYLHHSRSRPNLQIISEASVVSLKLNGNRVEGVRYEKDGVLHTVLGDQVVLCAGVYHTPQILMLSGIGPVAELERHGIAVIHALEGVGRNYQDHAGVSITFEGAKDDTEESESASIRLFIKSDPQRECLDFHIIMREPIVVAGAQQLICFTAYLLEQRNRGRIFLKSADPHEEPGIDPRLLEDAGDIKAMVAAMEFIRSLAETQPMKAYCGRILQPGPNEDWAAFARSTYSSYSHGVGTCMMGPMSNQLSVVGQRLRVHGMANLWIGDASIMPTVPHANTNATVIMIGERLSDFIDEST